jgi:hypothetical protein
LNKRAYLMILMLLGGALWIVTQSMPDGHAEQPDVPSLMGRTLNESALAAAPTERRHLLLLTVPGLTFTDVEQLTEHLPKPVRRFSLGGMTLRTANGMNSIHNLATLATGRMIELPRDWNGYHADEPVKLNDAAATALELYRQWSGRSSEADILHPALFSFADPLADAETLQPGWLGTLLEEQGIVTYVFGNSDAFPDKQRYSSMIVMNRWGESSGVIDARILTHSPFFPTGTATDYDQLHMQIERMITTHSASFIVAEIGDVERIQAQQHNLSEGHKQDVWAELYASLGSFLRHITVWQQLASEKNERLDVWLLAPFVSKEAQRQGELLAPFLVWNAEEAGVISSLTTRQTGLLANVDFVPSVLSYFGLPVPNDLVGRAFEIEQINAFVDEGQQQVSLTAWSEYVHDLFTIYKQRRPIITLYILVVMFLLIVSTLVWWFYRERYGIPIIQLVVGTILYTPVYFLWLTPLITYVNEHLWISALFMLSGATSALTYTFFRPYMIGLVCWVTSFSLLLDLALDSVWMKRSFLGFDPLIAARFYGIGNEYAGILIGAAVLSLTAGKQILWSPDRTDKSERKRRLLFKLFAFGWFVLHVYMLGVPGSNFGATVAAVLTFIVAYCLLFQVKLRLKSVLLLSAGALLSLLGLMLLHLNQEHTHIGAALQLLLSGKAESLVEVVQRKWALNIRLIRVSLWGKLFVLCLIVLLLILFRRKKEEGAGGATGPHARETWFNGLRAIVVGSVFLLLLNDSGIVAAATAMLFVTFPFIYLQSDETGRDGLRAP